jgi:pimeloyl-ACP methyl ester carboxylesterase
MYYKLISIIFLLLPFTACAGQRDMNASMSTGECAVLLHGLGRTSDSMDLMAEGLREAGYSTVNLDYPSRKRSIETLALKTVREGIEKCRATGALKLHFITHSMGGILLRYYLAHHSIDDLGRVVMLSPPNKGSEVADTLRDWSLYQWYNGPAGQQLGTGPDSLVMKLGPVDYPVGIITGDSPAFFDFWLEDMIPGPGDGKVSVERAKVEGMSDFLVVPYSHSFIMEQEDVIEQTLHFLANGTFSR